MRVGILRFFTSIVLVLIISNISHAQHTIVLDPGHGLCLGCSTGGQTTYNGQSVKNVDGRCLEEIETVLSVAQILKQKLEANCSPTNVIMTRESNVVPASEWMNASQRADFANAYGADLFLSIHTNACGAGSCSCTSDNSAHGTETYYTTEQDALGAGTNPHSLQDESFSALVDEKISLVGSLDIRPGSPKHTISLGVLSWSDNPNTCLNEIGFHTNASERAKLTDPYWQERFAQAYFEAIVETLGMEDDCPGYCVDTQEQNNIQSEAAVINYDFSQSYFTESFSGCIDHMVQDEDWHTIPVDEIGELEITLGNQDLDTHIEVYDAVGIIASSVNNGLGSEVVAICTQANMCSGLWVRVFYTTSYGVDTPIGGYSLVFVWDGDACNGPQRLMKESEILERGSSTMLVTASQTDVCLGQTIGLYAQGGSGLYNWHDSDGQYLGFGESISVTPDQEGSNVYKAFDDGDNCLSDNITINVSNVIAAEIYPASSSILVGESVVLGLSVQSSGSYSYEWSPVVGLSCSTCEDPVASPQSSTVYTILIADAAGCSTEKQTSVFVSNSGGGSVGCSHPHDHACDALALYPSLDEDNSSIGVTLACSTPTGSSSISVCESGGVGDIWYKVHIPPSGEFELFLENLQNQGSTDTWWMNVYTGSDCSNLTHYVCVTDDGSNPGSMPAHEFSGFMPGTYVWVQIGGGLVEEGATFVFVDKGDYDDDLDVNLEVYTGPGHNNNVEQVGAGWGITFDIYNSGSQTLSGNFLVQFLASSNQSINMSDGWIGTKLVTENLSPGERMDVTIYFRPTYQDLSHDDYYIAIMLDAARDIDETDEFDNESYFTQSYPSLTSDTWDLPDYEIREFNFPDNLEYIYPGQQIQIEWEVENDGDADACCSTRTYITLGTNNFCGPSDYILADEYTSQLDENDEDGDITTVLIPSSIIAGEDYEICICADAEIELGWPGEGDNRGDNCECYEVEAMSVPPVLDITTEVSLSQTSICGGEDLHIHAEVINSGTLKILDNHTARIYMHEQGESPEQGVLVGSMITSSLDPGEDDDEHFTYTIPCEQLNTSRIITIVSDVTNILNEESEANNSDSEDLFVESCLPGIDIESLPIFGCKSEPLYFTAPTCSGCSYVWTFSDGSTYAEKDFFKSFILPGNYTYDVVQQLDLGLYACSDIAYQGSLVVASCVTPAEITMFDIWENTENATCELVWFVASEVGVSHYVIERSLDGITFEGVGSVAADHSEKYTFESSAGSYLRQDIYYRINAIDFDGYEEATPVRTCWIQDGYISSEMPYQFIQSDGDIYLSLDRGYGGEVRIYDALGRKVYSAAVDGQTEYHYAMNAYPPGVYFLYIDIRPDDSTGMVFDVVGFSEKIVITK